MHYFMHNVVQRDDSKSSIPLYMMCNMKLKKNVVNDLGTTENSNIMSVSQASHSKHEVYSTVQDPIVGEFFSNIAAVVWR